jgi:uncharacterized protein YcbX
MRIEYLYRFPVKGLTAEAMEATEVEAGEAIPWDRAFALVQGDSDFDPANPEWRHKSQFLCLMKNAKAALLSSAFDEMAGIVTIRAPDGQVVSACGLHDAGRTAIGQFLIDYLGDDARGTPRFVHAPGHVFSDQRAKVVSLINLASLRDYEEKVDERRHRRRFRANVWFIGAPAWQERAWIGQKIQLGGAVLRVVKGITRCAATEVNPETGERDADPVEELRRLYGHTELGIHAEVVERGRFAIGDGIQLLGD